MVELNADFSRRAAVHAARLAWAPSPVRGVERRMLDRIGDEVARATSIVRYAPDSRFPAHTHGGGEEFLVLEGIFEDEHGEYPVGSYVRNPPTSRHTPGSGPGCVIFVKLRQFKPSDRTEVRIETSEGPYISVADRPGVEWLPLFRDEREDVRLERWSPGARIEHQVDGGIELLVLAGSFREGGEEFVPQSWLRLPAGARLLAHSGAAGCRVWVKAGHLSPESLRSDAFFRLDLTQVDGAV
jgi:hypothetical protein